MKRWHALSNDPNASEVLNLRRSALAKARAGHLVKDRVDYLSQLVVGKTVLDIGVVEHTREAAQSPHWLHGHLKRHARRCTGVDILEAEVRHLNECGYEVVVADVTRTPLPQKFDVIIGGEVLEHLDSPGLFMKNCAEMLNPAGRLAITVPNPWYINVVLKNLRCQVPFVDSADHVAWHEASTLFELGQRNGLELDRYAGIKVTQPITLRAKLFFALEPSLIKLGFAPEVFAKSVIYEFIRSPANDAIATSSGDPR